MRGFFGKLTRWIIYLAAAGVMFLALLVGIARLMLPLVPEYQNDIRRWAAEATGFDVEFEYISASWPLSGPELRFFEVTISTRDDGQPILEAESLTVGVSILRLLFEREFVVSRIGVAATRIEVRTPPGGSVLIQGRPAADLFPLDSASADGLEFPDIRITLDDIELLYAGAEVIDSAVRFFIDDLDLRLFDSGISVDGNVDLDDEFGERAEFSLEMPVQFLRSLQHPDSQMADDAAVGNPGPAWSAYLAGEDLEIGRILEALLDMEVPLTSGRGDIFIIANFAGMVPDDAVIDIDLSDLEMDAVDGDTVLYDEISGQLEWDRSASGWTLAANGLQFARDGRSWPDGDFTLGYSAPAGSPTRQIDGSASFLRLHDLYPIVRAITWEGARSELLPHDIGGDIRDLDFDLTIGADRPARYALTMEFDRLGLAISPDGDAISGISGSVVADQDGGRLQIDSEDSEVLLPKIFNGPLETESVDGLLVWRTTAEQIRVISDNVRLRTPYASGNTRFELNVPLGDEPPSIDLTGFASMQDGSESLRYLPMKIFPPALETWLERAIVAGRVPAAKFELSGVLNEFPYDHGEGVFRIAVDIEDGVLDYAAGWPLVNISDAQIVFDGVRFYVTRNRGRIGAIPFGNADARIDDIRTAVLKVSARETVALNRMLTFLRASPISEALGPTLDQVRGNGSLDTELRLTLPTLRLTDYRLNVDVSTEGAEIGLNGLDFGFDQLTGKIEIENTKVRSEYMTARLLGEPVTIEIRPAAKEEGLYTHFAAVEGATPVERWMEALNLPFPDRLSGRIEWNAMALIPERDEEEQTPFHILLRSDLEGVESELPVPFAKDAGGRDSFDMDIAFPADGVMEILGRLRSEISWAMRLESADETWRIERGALHAGSAVALLPPEPGVELSGTLDTLRFDDWLTLAGDGEESEWMELYRKADFRIGQLYLFGHAFADVEVDAMLEESSWRVDFDGPKIQGRVTFPREISAQQPVDVRMVRLWLQDLDPEDTGTTDPRDIQPVAIEIDDFALRTMMFGSLKTNLKPVSAGIMVDPIRIQAEVFHIEGSAAWLVHPNDESIQQSQLQLELEGTDIKGTLVSLGYDPVMEGEVARVIGDVTWPGGPGENFLNLADGSLLVELEKGALLDIEPGGGGRLLGILSVAALPRRLSLDFSDVFDEGLGFDSLSGYFFLNQGNAYTCNLSLEGSVADLGIAGRAGLGARDYDQVALIRPHVGNVFAVPATVVGGPAVGAAVLLFAQIFKKPLSALGQSYYRITGSWDEPTVEKIRGEELNLSPIQDCEQYLATEIPRLSPE